MIRRRLVGAAALVAAATLAPAAGAATRTPVSPAPALTLDSVSLTATWKESWLTGSVKFAGTATADAGPIHLLVVLRPVGRTGATPAGTLARILPTPGAFSGTIKLPRRLLPGLYRLTASAHAGAVALGPVTRDVRNPAPVEGIVDTAVASARESGPKANTVRGPRRELWARFHFLVPPRSGTVRVAWFSPDFKWYGIAKKPYRTTVETYVRTEAALMKGVWFCFASVNGRYVKRIRIRIS